MRRLIVIMGVAGCGKTSVGRALADRLACAFVEADDHHSRANIAKMSSGRPLTDEDRRSWVEKLIAAVEACSEPNVVLACSALTSFVQSQLQRVKDREVIWIHLVVGRAELLTRLQAREHFMPPSLLESQFEALAVPEGALSFDGVERLDSLVARVAAHLS